MQSEQLSTTLNRTYGCETTHHHNYWYHYQHHTHHLTAVFVLKTDVKLQPTNQVNLS